jgi:hypothetical protein
MKSNISFLFTFYLFVLFQISCKKDQLEIIDLNPKTNFINSKLLNVPQIKSIEDITYKDSIVELFLTRNREKINIETLKKAHFSKVLFLNKREITGLVIHYFKDTHYEKEILFVINYKSNISFEIIREIYTDKLNPNISSIQFKEINGNLITNDQLEFGRVIKNKSISNNDFLIKSSMVPIWHCTAAMFNMIYQEAKKKCEENAICDFACSFSNCSISYLAYAIDKCTINA